MGYLDLKGLTKQFLSRDQGDWVTAVDAIDLSVEPGELITLLGPSGCGKTTTLRMIAGFELPSGGELILDGELINTRPPNQRQMAMVFQSYALFPHLSVFENVAYGLRLRSLTAIEINKRVGSILELVGLQGLGDRAPNQLSGGQQQRVALARALVLEPKVLLMDEPLSNLDAKLRETMRTEIRRIQQTLGITTLYVTHDQLEAITLSDRIVVMNGGRIEQVDPPRRIYEQPASVFVADFIGQSNFLDGILSHIAPEHWHVQVMDRPIAVPKRNGIPEIGAGEPIKLLIRPEAIQIGEQGSWQGTVARTTYLGSYVEYEVRLGDAVLTVLDTDSLRPRIYEPGAPVGLSWADQSVCLLPH
jgi:iron(III) transport system ATP-binding protein